MLAGSALRLSLQDSNVSRISYVEYKFSKMNRLQGNFFDNPDVMNQKVRTSRELTDQIKYSDKEGGIANCLNRKAVGFSIADDLGSAYSTAEQTESLKLGIKGHNRL